MLLKKLIKNPPKQNQNLKVKGLAINSTDVKRGFIFFALKGNRLNGENYIYQAIKKGATVIVCSEKCKYKSKKICILRVKDPRKLLGITASKFYKAKPKNIIAVTGTNGKTSVAEFFYQILKLNKVPVASIGTLGIKYKDDYIKTNLTSPDIVSIHKNLELIKKKGIDNVIIEASSHGLTQNRLNFLKLKAGIFTNFSQDHLDYHKSMKNYLKAKLILFSKLLDKKSFIISDRSIKQYSILKKIANKRGLTLIDIQNQLNVVEKQNPPLIGKFQIKNLSMAILAAKLCNINNINIEKIIPKIKNVDGRLELIKRYRNNINVFIDYAHTPEALNEAIKSLKNYFNNNISIVFGCGGERDFKKRSLMGKIVKSLCYKIYVTDDNPRNENPEKIRREIIKSLKGSNYFNIGNRSQAIKKAILNAEPNETILVAGKGHESYQDYGKKVISISDKQIIKKIKINKVSIKLNNHNFFFNSKILNMILKDKRFYKFDGLAIDSRDIKKNQLFLAIKGKNNDGNKFIPHAKKKGASYIISAQSNKNKSILVRNPLSFLNEFAILKRENCNAKIIAITGSTGKTSLKNLLKILLENFNSTYASQRSFNNHFGVPISLSNLNLTHKFGVFEVGMNKAGEINKLSKIIKPNIAIITNIAEAHIENFKNIKGIAKAKSEVINNIEEGGTLIINRDDKFFEYLSKKAKLKGLKVVSFGKSERADVKILKVKKQGEIKALTVNVRNEIVNIKIKNINSYNVLAALAVLNELNLNSKKVLPLFKNIQPSQGRGKIHNVLRYKKKFVLIDESYNASPFTVKNAIDNFSQIKKDNFKKYLLLGDMLELGKKTRFYHEELAKLINSSDIDKVFIKGKNTFFTYKNLIKKKRGNIFQCSQDIDLILKNIIANKDYLMVKGSNAMGLSKISKAMIKGT